jgi:hypothetical protein
MLPYRNTLINIRPGDWPAAADAEKAVVGSSQIEAGLPDQKSRQKEGGDLRMNQDSQAGGQANHADAGFPLGRPQSLHQF